MPEIESEDANISIEPKRDPRALLRRSVLWVGVIALLCCVGCAIGVFFGIQQYRIVLTQSPSRYQAAFLRLTQMWIIERTMLTIAAALLARALFRYAGALQQAGDHHAPSDTASLEVKQTSCWQAVIWLALLYAGWEISIAFAKLAF
jgi:uncharacterized membrane protein